MERLSESQRRLRFSLSLGGMWENGLSMQDNFMCWKSIVGHFKAAFMASSELCIHIICFLAKIWFKVMDPHWSLIVTSTSEIFVWLVSPNVIEVQILLQQYFKAENRVKNLRPRGQTIYHLKKKKRKEVEHLFLKRYSEDHQISYRNLLFRRCVF